jgi:hypothetical protein
VDALKELALALIAKITKIELTFDLAAGAIALIALYFSIRARRNQERLAVETIRIARDNDVIRWSNDMIDTIVGIEFLLRPGSRPADAAAFAAKRDDFLAKLSASIEKGRLYFPNVDHRKFGTDKEAAYRGHRQPILDRLVEIYDLLKDADPQDAAKLDALRAEVLNKKKAFVSEAQSAVEPRRRVMFLKRRGHA